VETGALLSKLNKSIPGAVLEKTRFGRSEQISIWIETRNIVEIARFLRDEPGVELDWLENLSAMQLDDAIVLTYVLRSSATNATLFLRGSLAPEKSDTEVEMPSVTPVWAMAEPMEREILELFGVKFTASSTRLSARTFSRVLPGFKGYPLRKGYKFPKEVDGITHSRPPNRPLTGEAGHG
jgi:NADH-quinone oxidoreductase subunit C